MLGENIKKYRQEKRYTQEEVAARLHVTRQTVSKWEKNYSVPDADLLVKLAEILEVETGCLLGDRTGIRAEERDAYAEQLAHIAEQLAVKNRQSKRIWQTIGIVLAVIVVVNILLIVLGIVFSAVSYESGGTVCEEEIREEVLDGRIICGITALADGAFRF